MKNKRLIILLLFMLLFSIFVSAQAHFFDYGFGRSAGFSGGVGFISNLCNSIGSEVLDFFLYLIIVTIIGVWAFGKRSKGNVLAAAIGAAVAFAAVRWESFNGFSLLCGFGGTGDLAGGLFGGFSGIIFIGVLVILALLSFKKDNPTLGVAIAAIYLIFMLWFYFAGGTYGIGFLYYLPLDTSFINLILGIFTFVFILSLVVNIGRLRA